MVVRNQQPSGNDGGNDAASTAQVTKNEQLSRNTQNIFFKKIKNKDFLYLKYFKTLHVFPFNQFIY